MPIDVALPAGMFARAEIGQRYHQLGAHRDGNFSSRGRCRRAAICRKIDQRDVGLVPDGGYERNHAGSRGAHDNLFVE